MPNDAMELIESPPPRAVFAWTRVRGHVLMRSSPRPFCSCGWSSENLVPADEAIAEHLRDAWPILVPREEGEPYDAWRQRVAVVHGDALEERERVWDQERMGEPTPPGRPFPVISDDWSRADDRTLVLGHQLSGMRLPAGL